MLQFVRADLRKHSAAMANAVGGVILLGVQNDGHVTGFEITDKVWQHITEEANSCEPSVRVSVSQWNKIVSIEVFKSEDKLVSTGTGFFIRNESTTQKMGERSVKRLVSIR